MSGYMRGDEVTGGDGSTTIDGVDIHDTDLLFMQPNGRGQYWGIGIDSSSKKGGDVEVTYHIDSYDYDLNSTREWDECHAVFRSTGNKSYPYTLISIDEFE